MLDFSNIKLIIWDLDDTLWQGTISEGEVVIPAAYIRLIQRITDCGIVNAICSKNDEAIVNAKLEEYHIKEYFVFNSIDWTPKGGRISNMIQNMGLRPVNVLFIDDNTHNLQEAQYLIPDIMTAMPDIIPELISYFDAMPAKDVKHNRLQQYKVLKQKQTAKAAAEDNIAFLYSTHTKVIIKHDCMAHLDRIYELVNRTNQLNFTKLRSTREELAAMLTADNISSGYVEVEDDYGKYGIVGFYAIKDNTCVHFLFSCRTMGQGIEQYVYSILNYPHIHITGEVASSLEHVPTPAWINQHEHTSSKKDKQQNISGKVLFKGPCDLSSMVFYFESNQVLTEFTYMGGKHQSVEHHNHSVNYLRFPFLSVQEQQTLLQQAVFNDEAMFDTAMYNKDVKLIFLSTLIEVNLAVYRRKSDGYLMAFGEWCNDLTDKANIEKFLNQELYCYSNEYTRKWLETFGANWDYLGRISAEDYVANLEQVLSRINADAKICLILGSELPYENNHKPSYNNRHIVHKEYNRVLRAFAQTQDRVLLLDVNDYVNNQDDFSDNINHFQRRVYYQMAQKANEYIQEVCGSKIKGKSITGKIKDRYIPMIKVKIYNAIPACVKKVLKK